MTNRSSNSSIDWLELDRLVDGRLSDEEYHELLCQIDADPDGWRQCALAFLEHQALTRELSAFAMDPSCDLLPCMGSIASEPKPGVSPDKPVSGKKAAAVASGSKIAWLTMALSIVCGLAMGLTLQSDFRDRVPAKVDGLMTNVNASFSDKPVVVTPEKVEEDKQRANRCRDQKSSGRYTLENCKSKQARHDSVDCDAVCPLFQEIDKRKPYKP